MGWVLSLKEIGQSQVARAGGKGALSGELSRIEGVSVPPGFCVTTEAFDRIIAEVPAIDDLLDRLSRLEPGDRERISALGAETRRALERIPVPADLTSAITRALAEIGESAAYAVRSSATAEDSSGASFAGQHDTFLNVTGAGAILRHVRLCWSSLFSDRAVAYRLRNGIEHGSVQMAVLVQQMLSPDAAGVLFTADPLTSNRRIASVEACFGLGEALVSGVVNADVYRVRDGEVLDKDLAVKQVAIHASPAGGTQAQAVEPARRERAALTDGQIVRLAQIGRRIEAHFGCPQDIEWCLVDDEFHFVQSRPITRLFPIPATGDEETHIYISVGHQQMMTDAMKPLGLSFWQLTTARPMAVAAGRLFVDVAPDLASPTGRERLVTLGRSDPLIGNALEMIIERGDLIPSRTEEAAAAAPIPAAPPPEPIETDPEIVAELIALNQASIATLKRDIATKQGPALLEFIQADIRELKRILFDPRSTRVFMTAIRASHWLNEQLQAWLGEKNAADTLTQSVENNVTSQMGLGLLDVADAIRPHGEVVAFLRRATDDSFLEELPALAGGRQARAAIQGYLDSYGMRCAGEIDITRPRWSERPSTLLPMLLGNIENFEPGEGRRRFQRGRQEAQGKAQELLARLRRLPDGERKAEEAEQMIDRVRVFSGYREYPKYGMVSRYFVYKQALLEEAERLVRARVLDDPEDIFYLTVEELHELSRTRRLDGELLRRRREDYSSYRGLMPPRVFTSEGEVITGSYGREDAPAGALVGLAVSAGTIEGRARVVLDMAQAELRADDILVTTYTDPSWTPLFVAIKGLVTEVGGLMTHGAVIAREYGLPAVVGVERATQLIRDGQRIRVNGTDGFVEILSP